MTSFFETSLKEKINLFSGLSGWGPLMEQGSRLIAEALSAGRRLVFVVPQHVGPLGDLVLRRFARRFHLPCGGAEVLVAGSDGTVTEKDCPLFLCPGRPDHDVMALAHRVSEAGLPLLLLCGEDSWLLGGMAHWKAQVPSRDEERASEALLWLADCLFFDAQRLLNQ